MVEMEETMPSFGSAPSGGAVAHFDDKVLKDLEEQVEQSDPRFARAMDSGRPRRPREYRRSPAWLVLAMAVAMLVTGIALPNGLLIATGLVVAGIAGHLFEPFRDDGSDRLSARGRRAADTEPFSVTSRDGS